MTGRRRRSEGHLIACPGALARCHAASSERVGHENLDSGSGRWPSFSAAARNAGFASASALPLRLREVTLGALNLLSVTRAPMAEADLIAARAFADLAAPNIVPHRAAAEAQLLNEQLSGALDQPRSPGCGPTPATTTSASPTSPRPPSTAPSTRWPGPPPPCRFCAQAIPEKVRRTLLDAVITGSCGPLAQASGQGAAPCAWSCTRVAMRCLSGQSCRFRSRSRSPAAAAWSVTCSRIVRAD